MLQYGTLPDELKTANFGSGAVRSFEKLREYQPKGPMMCMEYWNGWFDHWGEKHHITDPSNAAERLDEILAASDYKPREALAILEQAQGAYGHLPVAALQHIAHQTGAGYSELYGIATSYPHLHFEPPVGHTVRVCRCTQCTLLGGGRVLAAFREHLGTDIGGVSPDGAVRLASTDCGGASSGAVWPCMSSASCST